MGDLRDRLPRERRMHAALALKVTSSVLSTLGSLGFHKLPADRHRLGEQHLDHRRGRRVRRSAAELLKSGQSATCRYMLRLACLVGGLVLVAWLPGVAVASTHNRLPDASALRSEGLRVTWPVKAATAEVAANSFVCVIVRRVDGYTRRPHAARISARSRVQHRPTARRGRTRDAADRALRSQGAERRSRPLSTHARSRDLALVQRPPRAGCGPAGYSSSCADEDVDRPVSPRSTLPSSAERWT